MAPSLTLGPPSPTLKRVNRLGSWLPPACLLAYGILFVAQALPLGELLVYDDHPGQFVRLWMGRESLRHGAWTADWHPEWFAGYPELQFYPPGFVILGLILHGLAGARLPLETTYQLLLWVIYLLPGVSTLFLLKRLTTSPWAALPPAFVALTLSAGLPSGVEEGLRWGLIGARLGLGLVPLLALSLIPWLREGRWPLWGAPLLAAILLAHPYQFVPALLLVLLVGVFHGVARDRGRVALQGALVIGLAVGVTAFWLLPLLARSAHTVPLAWSRGEWSALLHRPALLSVASVYALGVGAALRQRDEFRPLRLALAVLPLAALLTAWVNRAILVEMWGIVLLDPDRLRDAVAFGLLWTAGFGWAWGTDRLLKRRAWLASLTAVILLGVLPQNPRDPDLTLWPPRQSWPTLSEAESKSGLAALREALRGAPAGRILFSTSAVRLEEGEAWYLPHSHLFAMIPIQTGREIVNGTFTHPSPIAGLVYTGSARPPAIRRLVEELDGRQLFGEPPERLSPSRLAHLLNSLGVSTVVVPGRDSSLIATLEHGGLFTTQAVIGAFRLFTRHLSNEATRHSRRRTELVLRESRGEWVGTGLFAYPLWGAVGPGGPLPLRETPERLLEVYVPPGQDIRVTLRYREGGMEWAGVGLTALSLVVWAFQALRRRGANGGRTTG